MPSKHHNFLDDHPPLPTPTMDLGLDPNRFCDNKLWPLLRHPNQSGLVCPPNRYLNPISKAFTMKRTTRFLPSLENLESLLCLDGTALADPLFVGPIVIAQLPQVPDPTEVLQAPAGTVVPPGNTIVTVVTDAYNGVNQTLKQGFDNMTQATSNTINTLLGPNPDPAPGPIVAQTPVQITPEPVGPVSVNPIVPYAIPTTPVPTPQTVACLPNSCSNGFTSILYGLGPEDIYLSAVPCDRSMQIG